MHVIHVDCREIGDVLPMIVPGTLVMSPTHDRETMFVNVVIVICVDHNERNVAFIDYLRCQSEAGRDEHEAVQVRLEDLDTFIVAGDVVMIP